MNDFYELTPDSVLFVGSAFEFIGLINLVINISDVDKEERNRQVEKLPAVA